MKIDNKNIMNYKSNASSNLLPGKLLKAIRPFVGVDVELQKKYQLTQKYYGHPGEILLIVSIGETPHTNEVLALINEKIVFFPWYGFSRWNEMFLCVDTETMKDK